MQFEIEFEAGHLRRVMEAARREIAQPADILRSMGETLMNRNQERHKQGLAPNDTKWKPLSPLTIKAGDRASNEPLKKAGRLLRSLHPKIHGNELRLSFDDFRVNGMLASLHHNGTQPYTIVPKHARVLAFAGIVAKRVNHPGLPKRELIGFPDSDKAAVEDVVASHLQQILQRAR